MYRYYISNICTYLFPDSYELGSGRANISTVERIDDGLPHVIKASRFVNSPFNLFFIYLLTLIRCILHSLMLE